MLIIAKKKKYCLLIHRARKYHDRHRNVQICAHSIVKSLTIQQRRLTRHRATDINNNTCVYTKNQWYIYLLYKSALPSVGHRYRYDNHMESVYLNIP